MIRFLADEDLDGRIIRGVRRHFPEIELTSINELGLHGTSDPEVLRIASEQDRVLLTHDKNTMVPLALDSIRVGFYCPGVVHINRFSQMGRIIDDIALIAGASHEDEWRNQVKFLPL